MYLTIEGKMNDKLVFKHVGFGFYKVVRSSFIFRPEAFISLSDDNYRYKRAFFNLWRRVHKFNQSIKCKE